MTISLKLTAGLLSAAFVAAAALPAAAQQSRVPRIPTVMQRGTMMTPAMQMHALPESGQTLRPTFLDRSPFGPAVVTGVQRSGIMFRSQSGFVGRMTLSNRTIQSLRMRSGTRFTLTQLRGGAVRIQIVAPGRGCPATTTALTNNTPPSCATGIH
jgi:hypothetical protein